MRFDVWTIAKMIESRFLLETLRWQDVRIDDPDPIDGGVLYFTVLTTTGGQTLSVPLAVVLKNLEDGGRIDTFTPKSTVRKILVSEVLSFLSTVKGLVRGELTPSHALQRAKDGRLASPVELRTDHLKKRLYGEHPLTMQN